MAAVSTTTYQLAGWQVDLLSTAAVLVRRKNFSRLLKGVERIELGFFASTANACRGCICMDEER